MPLVAQAHSAAGTGGKVFEEPRYSSDYLETLVLCNATAHRKFLFILFTSFLDISKEQRPSLLVSIVLL